MSCRLDNTSLSPRVSWSPYESTSEGDYCLYLNHKTCSRLLRQTQEQSALLHSQFLSTLERKHQVLSWRHHAWTNVPGSLVLVFKSQVTGIQARLLHQAQEQFAPLCDEVLYGREGNIKCCLDVTMNQSRRNLVFVLVRARIYVGRKNSLHFFMVSFCHAML
jgi:hypothetical protein